MTVHSDNGFVMTKNCFHWKRYGGTKFNSRRDRSGGLRHGGKAEIEVRAAELPNQIDVGIHLMIHNNTDTIHAIKVKCSDNALYRITPPLSTVQPTETLRIKIHRTHAPIKPDKIIVMAIPTVKEEQYLDELFKSPFVPHSKISITQRPIAHENAIKVVDSGENILAYYAPCAPEKALCLKFSAVKLAFNGEVGGDQVPTSVWFRPVFGIIEPKETFRIKITRSPHPKKRDKMIVCATV
ncbi:MSP domain protein, partial [Ostertagia ostertagi]